MAHLSKRVLAIAMLVLAAVTSVKANPKHTNTPTWCVAEHSTSNEILKELVNSLCGTPGVDCSAIQENAPCFYPNTYLHHTSYAMNYFYHMKGGYSKDCAFNGHGKIVHEFPLDNGGCYYHPNDHKNHQNHHQGQSHQNHRSQHAGQNRQNHHQGQNHHSTANHLGKNTMHWCVAKGTGSKEALQRVIDDLCKVIDCEPISFGGQCFEPDDHIHHASWAMNSFYQIRGQRLEDCYQGGLGQLTSKNPNYENCQYLHHKKEGNTHPEL